MDCYNATETLGERDEKIILELLSVIGIGPALIISSVILVLIGIRNRRRRRNIEIGVQ